MPEALELLLYKGFMGGYTTRIYSFSNRYKGALEKRPLNIRRDYSYSGRPNHARTEA